jgi:hypothetical protein
MKPVGQVSEKPDLEGFDGLFAQVKAELNFLRLPYFATCKSARQAYLELSETVERDGLKRQIQWQVNSNPKLGLPGSIERNLMFWIFRRADEMRQSVNAPVPDWIDIGSLYSICAELKLESNGQNRRRLKLALEKLSTTQCISKGAYYDKASRAYIESGDVFTFLTSWRLRGEPYNGTIAESNMVAIHPWVRSNLDAFYVKSLDWELLRSLEIEISALLYPHLSCVFHAMRKDQEYIELSYSWLAQRLGIKVWDELKEAKKQLKAAHSELCEKGYLAKVEWFNDKLRYFPGIRASFEIVSQRKRKRAATVKRPKTRQLVIPSLEPLTQEMDVRQNEIARQAARVKLGKEVSLDRLAMFDITEEEVLSFAASQKVAT